MTTINCLDVEVEVANQDGEVLAPEFFMRELFDETIDNWVLVRDTEHSEVPMEAIFQVVDNKLTIGIEITAWASRHSFGTDGLDSLNTAEGSVISEALKFYMAEAEVTPEFSYRITGVRIVSRRRTLRLPEGIKVEEFLEYLGSVCSTPYGLLELVDGDCTSIWGDVHIVFQRDISNESHASDEDTQCGKGNSLRVTYWSINRYVPLPDDSSYSALLALYESRPLRDSANMLSGEVAELWHQWTVGTISEDRAKECWETVYEAAGVDIRRPYDETERYWATSPFKDRGALHILRSDSSL